MVTKWKPYNPSIYVIPDIHGMLQQLNLVLSRILPLRNRDDCEDKIIFLGDYVDRGIESHLLLDKLIELEAKYPTEITFLRGNHEEMFMEAYNLGVTNPNKYDFWFANGGKNTIAGYMQRAGLPSDQPHLLPRYRLKDIVPIEHIKFLENKLKNYYEMDNYIFVHAGCDPLLPLDGQEKQIFFWDRSLYTFARSLKSGQIKRSDGSKDLPWDKTIIAGHNCSDKIPFVDDKFVMLDCSMTNSLMVLEINSKQIFKAQTGVSRLVRVR